MVQNAGPITWSSSVYGDGFDERAAWHLHTATMSGGATPRASFWKDDTKLMEQCPESADDVAKNPPRQLQLNGFAGENQTSRCEIAEAILFNRALSDTELDQLWRYFEAKYRVVTPRQPTPRGLAIERKPTVMPARSRPGRLRPDSLIPAIRMPGVVSRRKVRHLGTLGSSMPTRTGRLVRPSHVRTGKSAIPISRRTLRASVKVRVQGCLQLVESGELGPENLIELYQRAGAKYFVALANHHCNFDCWDSKYQPWNSVNIGPKKDIVGGWAAAARRHGMRFGVTVHCASLGVVRSGAWLG